MFHHYCFAHEVSVITNHKPFIAIFKKDIASLSQRLQQIPLHIPKYRIIILYKPALQLYIANWLSKHNHKEGKDEEIRGTLTRLLAHESINCVNINKDIEKNAMEHCLTCLEFKGTQMKDNLIPHDIPGKC